MSFKKLGHLINDIFSGIFVGVMFRESYSMMPRAILTLLPGVPGIKPGASGAKNVL